MTIDIDPKTSPMMAQWHSCKKSAPSSILFFRLGDFYEAFYEDAILLSKELGLTLTKRQEIPMAGVPFHSSESYIDRLVGKGYRVAIAEQMEDPSTVKGLVKREIVRVITPGTIVNSTLLSDKANNFLACIVQVGDTHGLSVLDLTTADFRAMEFETLESLEDELSRLQPKEILVSEKWHLKHGALLQELKTILGCTFHIKEDWHFDHRHACDVLLRHFRIHNLDGFGLKGMIPAINACGAMLHYVAEDLNLKVGHITSIVKHQLSCYMLLDRSAQKNLELFESIPGEKSGKNAHTLLKLLDHTQTPMGGRLLKTWMTHPLLEIEEIKSRQDGIAELIDNPELCKEISSHLNQIRDLERLVMRIETGYASPRDLASLRDSLQHIAPLQTLLESLSAEIICSNRQQLHNVSNLAKTLQNALTDTPPIRLSDGDIFRTGYHTELDTLKTLQTNSHSWVARYQVELKEATQIKTLKVGYTRAFGYYIEVSKGQADKIPEHFQRKQTLVNAERFVTAELKAFEHQMLHAEEQISSLENQLFNALRKEISDHASKIRCIAQAVAVIDCLYSLNHVAKKHHYVRPLIDETDTLRIIQGRHPVIEASISDHTFIPNDVFLGGEKERLYLITGPNMAGKSTFIRQVALIAILAQMGSFVPAKEAHIGVIDKIFSRIGASDDLSRGQSTFMVEMTETSAILHNATNRSLVILDEIGRGTSTFDGISIAWAVAEYLLTEPGKRAKTLFATHYWELTALEKEIVGAVNYNVAVHETPQGIIFLHKIVKGGTDKSYGIHVAKLAGLPQSVLRRAETMLQKLEKKEPQMPEQKARQLPLFNVETALDKVSSAIKAIDPNQLTPLEALQKIMQWKEKLLS